MDIHTVKGYSGSIPRLIPPSRGETLPDLLVDLGDLVDAGEQLTGCIIILNVL